jgi:hypothetical protein
MLHKLSGRAFFQMGQQFMLTADRDLHRPSGRAAQPALCCEVLVEIVCKLAREVIATF